MGQSTRWMLSMAMAVMVSGGALPAAAQTPAPAPSPQATPPTTAPSPQTTPPAAAPGQETAAPEQDITSDIELTRASIHLRRQALVTAAMDLEPRESDVFWPLYRQYRAEMLKVNDRFVNLLVAYLEGYDSLSDAQAAKLLDDYLGIEKARTGVKTKYVPRFKKVLPARKVARFFQVDNKLDSVLNAQLAADVPLVR